MRRAGTGRPPEELREAGRRIQRRVLGLSRFHEARVVAAYLALPGEVPTQRVCEAAWRAGKRLCVPARVSGAGGYVFAELRRDTALEPGPFGVPQPRDPGPVDSGDIDLALVPGVAFDRQGGRIGHGGGHFDRLLAGCSAGVLLVGLAFEFQLCDGVPMDAHDVRLDGVITERTLTGV
jgi:5-formyltetrahydrofolate cyclo-ligase